MMFSCVSFLKEWIFECHGNLSSVPKPVSNGRKLPVILTRAKPEADIPKLSSWLASNVLELINCTNIGNVISVSGPDRCSYFYPCEVATPFSAQQLYALMLIKYFTFYITVYGN